MGDINPRVDIAFKKIFGVEENKDLLISLINSIVGAEDQVADVTLLNPYNPKNFKDDKISILDIKAKGVDGKMFNIEVQISDEADYNKRALYYWAKLYTQQLKASEDYANLCKAIGIHILNFTSIPESKKYHNVFHITEKENGLLYFKDLELHTIELKKFTDESNGQLTDMMLRVKSSLDLWSAFLIRHDLVNPDKVPSGLDKASLKKAMTVLEVMNFTEEERNIYEGQLKWLRIEASTLRKAENKGEARGLAKGLAKGLEQGRQEGIERNKLDIAKSMIKKGFNISSIAELTGLDEDTIQSLMQE